MTSVRSLGVSFLLVLFLGVRLAVAAGPDAKAEATRLFDEVMSPFCPGLTLADCPSQQAFELRDEITARLEAGDRSDAVVSDLIQQYGVSILADPTSTPVGAIVWGTPILVAVCAAIALALFVRRSVERSRLDDEGNPITSPELDRMLDEQLHALD